MTTFRQIECWRWRYREPQSGRICQTTSWLTMEEAAAYLDAERINGTMCWREIEDNEETTPAVFR
jgi:hypothetical protein